MHRHSLVRLALVAVTTVGGLTAVAVPAHAEEAPTAGLPGQSEAPWHAAPWTVPHGRKLR